MINKLLVAFLNRNKRLIIPTIGAFVKREVEGVGTVLVFVPFLNKDDGVLCSIIKTWSGVDDDNEANEILQQYIAAIHESLNRGQYTIEGLGALKYDTNHIIYLEKEGTKPQAQPQLQSTEAEISDSQQENSESSSVDSTTSENKGAESGETVVENSNDGDVENSILAPTSINSIGSAIEDNQSDVAINTPQENSSESDSERSTFNSECTNVAESEKTMEVQNEDLGKSIVSNYDDKKEQEDNAISPINPYSSNPETAAPTVAAEDSKQIGGQVNPKAQEVAPNRKDYRSLYEDGGQDSGVRYFSPKNSDNDSSSSYSSTSNNPADNNSNYNGGYNNSYNGGYNAGAIGNENKDIQNIYGRYNDREVEKNSEQQPQQQQTKPKGPTIEPVEEPQQQAGNGSATQSAEPKKVSDQQRFKELTNQQTASNNGGRSNGGSRGSSNSGGASRNSKHSNRRKKGASNGRKSNEKKGSDLIIWIAIIAVALTIGVLIYGFNYNSEPTLDDFEMSSDIDIVDTTANL